METNGNRTTAAEIFHVVDSYNYYYIVGYAHAIKFRRVLWKMTCAKNDLGDVRRRDSVLSSE